MMEVLNAINWHACFFYLFAAIACGFALAMVVSSNVVRMAFYLIISLGAVAALFFLAGADFVGAMQLMIYVGGTLVLLAFGVMLTARGPLVSLPTSAGQWFLAAVIGASLLVVLLQTAWSVREWRGPIEPAQAAASEELATAEPLGLAMLGVRADQLGEPDVKLRSGMSGYLLPFEIISVHLLVVLIGAAYLARAKR